MELIDIVKAQVVETELALQESRDRFHYLNGWLAACNQIVSQLPSDDNVLVDPVIELVPED